LSLGLSLVGIFNALRDIRSDDDENLGRESEAEHDSSERLRVVRRPEPVREES
jgi:hypothetical protein